MSTPYSREIEFTAISNQSTCVVMPTHGRGYLQRLIVKQIDGVAEGFTYNVFNRIDACSSVQESSQNSEDHAELMDRDMHKVLPTQSVSNGNVLSELFEKEWPYENRDERDVSMVTKKQLYLEIVPNGTGTKTFQVAYTATGPEVS